MLAAIFPLALVIGAGVAVVAGTDAVDFTIAIVVDTVAEFFLWGARGTWFQRLLARLQDTLSVRNASGEPFSVTARLAFQGDRDICASTSLAVAGDTLHALLALGGQRFFALELLWAVVIYDAVEATERADMSVPHTCGKGRAWEFAVRKGLTRQAQFDLCMDTEEVAIETWHFGTLGRGLAAVDRVTDLSANPLHLLADRRGGQTGRTRAFLVTGTRAASASGADRSGV